MKLQRAPLIDAGFILVLGAIASWGFGDTFHGSSYLVAALLGLVLGIALAHLSNVLGRPVVLLAVFTIATFFLLGGAIALHSDGVSAMLPLPGTLRRLADASVHGWKDLLTTLAPVENGPLLTLPYLMALVTGASGMALAGRTRSLGWPVAPLGAYLAGVILLGIQSPSHITVLGVTSAVVAIAWVAARARRRRRTALQGQAWVRRGFATAMVLGCGALAGVVGPHLPGMGHERIVLRSYVSPPPLPGDYTSPLAGMRRYLADFKPTDGSTPLYGQTIMTVKGLPDGTFLRFAALDDYDGNVWRAANQSPGTTGAEGAFQGVGSVIRETGPGRRVTAHVTLAAPYDGQVWLPTAGVLTGIRFTDRTAKQQAGQLRYNLTTQTGIVPAGLHTGDSYTFTALVSPRTADKNLTPGAGESTDSTHVDYGPIAKRWAQAGGASDSASPMAQVMAIASYLRTQGTYDGQEGSDKTLPGHSLHRLAAFSQEGTKPTGDDEQYAAMMALLANQVGVPARAVMGAEIHGQAVKGSDVHAWIELRDADGQWLPMPVKDFMSDQRPPDDTPPPQQPMKAGQAVPPPAPVRPPSTSGDPVSSSLNHRGHQSHHGLALHAPAWVGAIAKYVGSPLFVLLAIAGAIVGAKELRRRRRRRRGTPAHRMASAWRDLVDHARDSGHAVTSHTTRREQAGLIGVSGFTTLAREADRHVFGAAEPTEADAAAYWARIDQMRADLTRGKTRWQRIRAAINLRSFVAPPKELQA